MFDVPCRRPWAGASSLARTVTAAQGRAQCYGGEIHAQRKCWRSKKRQEAHENIGRVEVPQEAFVAALNSKSN